MKKMPDKKELIITRLHGEDGYKIFSVRLPNSLVARLDVLAQESGRSRNELIGTFLEFALENCRIEDEKNSD